MLCAAPILCSEANGRLLPTRTKSADLLRVLRSSLHFCLFLSFLTLALTNEHAQNTHQVDAAVCACPAYDIASAWGHFGRESPRLDKLLLSSVKEHWLQGPSGEILARATDDNAAAGEALARALRATSMEEFVEAHSYFAGCHDGPAQYFQEHNPMR